MFSNNDYKGYFQEIENILTKTLVIYTDVLNEVEDKSIKNKLNVIASENMETFEFVQAQKEKFV
jgi:hypothetical protein